MKPFSAHMLFLLAQSGGAPSAPTLLSAAIAADGITLTLIFSSAVTATTPAAGWSIATGVVSSGVVSSGNIVLTIGTVYTGEVITVSYDSGTGDVVGLADIVDAAVANNSEQAAPIACDIPLNATPSEVTGAGFTGPLTLSNNDQTVSKVTDTTSGLYAAFNPVVPLDVSEGIKTVQLTADEFPQYLGAIGSHLMGIRFYDVGASIVYAVEVASTALLSNNFELHTSNGYFSGSLSAPPRKIGITFDAVGEMIHMKADGVLIESLSYTPQAVSPVVTITQNAPHADNAGQTITGTYVTAAADINQAVLPSTDQCGNSISAPAVCAYPFGATTESGDYEGGNSDPMTLSNNDQTMSCVLTGTPTNEFEAFPEGLWADRATTGGLTFTPSIAVIGVQLNLDTLPAHSGGGSGFTVAYAVNLAFLNKAFDDRVFVTVEATDDGRFYPALRNVAGTYVWEALGWVDNVLGIGLYHDPVGDRWGVIARTVTGATTTTTDYGYIAALTGYGMAGEMYGFLEVIEGAAAAGTSGETLTVSVLTDPTTWDFPFPAGTQGVCAAIA